MSLRLPVTLTLLVLAGTALSQSESKKPRSNVPPELINARWVFLTSYTADGTDYLTRPDPADQAAIADVRKVLREWGYYKEVASPDSADLVIAVRGKTNTLGARTGSGIDLSTAGGVRVTQPQSIGGPAEDAMTVFGGPHGSNGIVIWKRMKKDGLHAPKMQLVWELREFVESGKP
jgi:hypothetical protein